MGFTIVLIYCVSGAVAALMANDLLRNQRHRTPVWLTIVAIATTVTVVAFMIGLTLT